MKEITEILKAAYHWGRDNGEGRSDKNFNDFLNTFVVSKLEHLVNQEVEKRIAERMPSEEEIEKHFTTPHYHYEKGHYYKVRKDRIFGANWLRSRLVSQKTDNLKENNNGSTN